MQTEMQSNPVEELHLTEQSSDTKISKLTRVTLDALLVPVIMKEVIR